MSCSHNTSSAFSVSVCKNKSIITALIDRKIFSLAFRNKKKWSLLESRLHSRLAWGGANTSLFKEEVLDSLGHVAINFRDIYLHLAKFIAITDPSVALKLCRIQKRGLKFSPYRILLCRSILFCGKSFV